ncbi:uncharacterized protein LOC111284996 isoform X2 [Durio zibethinus]|uniref:Structure-specific endonuclease subunit SLX1 homolog n=1 Tax=Durio zibethinus TaxID=66656 RepID=A0A6P5XNJ4_DURZI|nr:uncharacterized protein LOC111284996 isoform X2 [Durio zibethinus]
MNIIHSELDCESASPREMRKGKTNEARKRNSEAGDLKSLVTYFKQRKSRTRNIKSLNLEGEKQEEIRDFGNENEGKRGKGFFACYLLTSLSPRHKGHTYVGFTVNPRRRIRQHNGEIASGAWRTKSKRPWEMVVCIYGFPTNVSALQFEWAWQHPQESLAVRQAAGTFKSFSGVANKIKLAYTMLTLPAWQSLNITVNYFSTKYREHSACCPSLPEQMKFRICSMDELPCYTEQDEFEYKDDCDNLDEFDEVNNTCETVWETYPDEVVNVSANNSHSSINEASHDQFEYIEGYGTRKLGDSSTLGVHNKESYVFIDSPTSNVTSIATALPLVEAAECADTSTVRGESLRTKQFTYAVEADEDPQLLVGKKLSTTYEECEKLGDSSNGKTAEVANISNIEKECPNQKQFAALVAANVDQQPWTRLKPLTTEVAVIEDQLPSSAVVDEVEFIDLLTPPPVCKVRSHTKKKRISVFSPEIIDLT